MSLPEDPYAVLGLPYGASRAQLRTAWRAAARTWHPDANPDDPAAAERFSQAKVAYELLMATLPPEEEQPARRADTEDVDEPLREGAIAHDPFALHAGSPRRGDSIKQTLDIDLDTAWWGGQRTIYLEYDVPCPACAGTGAQGCQCSGTGSSRILAWQKVSVPELSANGAVIRLPRRGGPGWGGQPPGDLDVSLRVSDPLWRVNGRELEAQLRISTARALSGATLNLPHPRGTLDVFVPPGSLEGYETVIEEAGLGAKARVSVKPTPLDLANPAVQLALSQLDQAERSTQG